MKSKPLPRITTVFLALLVAGCDNTYRGKEILRSDVPATFVAQYMAFACGDFYPQIQPVGCTTDSIDFSLLDSGLMFRVPDDLIAPDQLPELGVAGNRFEIRGYYHFVEEDGKRLVHPQFDLLAWRPLLPYRVWRFGPHPESEPPPQDSVVEYDTELEGWRSSASEPSDPEAFQYRRKYDDCM